MAKLTIRGGDLDLVEYEFSPFNIGENIETLGIKNKREPLPEKGIFTATAPARIHLTVLDMNRFAPNRPGGGGIGFAIAGLPSVVLWGTSGAPFFACSKLAMVRYRSHG